MERQHDAHVDTWYFAELFAEAPEACEPCSEAELETMSWEDVGE